MADLHPSVEWFATAGGLPADEKSALAELPLAELIAQCQGVLGAEARLHAWCAWRKVRGQALAIGLGPLVDAIESGAVVPETIRQAFETDYCRWWLGATVEQDNVIRGFSNMLEKIFSKLRFSRSHPAPIKNWKSSTPKF